MSFLLRDFWRSTSPLCHPNLANGYTYLPLRNFHANSLVWARHRWGRSCKNTCHSSSIKNGLPSGRKTVSDPILEEVMINVMRGEGTASKVWRKGNWHLMRILALFPPGLGLYSTSFLLKEQINTQEKIKPLDLMELAKDLKLNTYNNNNNNKKSMMEMSISLTAYSILFSDVRYTFTLNSVTGIWKHMFEILTVAQ